MPEVNPNKLNVSVCPVVVVVIFEQFKKLKTAEIDLMRTVPPNFKPYYKEKTNAYFDQIMIIQPK